MLETLAPRPRLLLVDDDEDAHVLVRDLLTEADAGWTLEWARGYDDGLRAMAETSYDFMFVDYHLGMGTGVELVAEAAARMPLPPFVVITSGAAGEAAALRAGAVAFVAKDEMTGVSLRRTVLYGIERARLLRELEERERQYRAVFASAGPMFVVDEEGRVAEANEAGVALAGRGVHALSGLRLLDALKTLEPLENDQSSSADEHRYMVVRMPVPTGSMRTLEVADFGEISPNRRLIAVRDATRLVRRQLDLEESERRLRALLDRLDLFATILDRDGRLVYINDAVATRLGIERSSVIGKRIAETPMVAPTGADEWEQLAMVFESGHIADEWENELLAHDGSIVRVSWSSVFVRDGEGSITGIASLGKDITALEAARSERRALEEQLRQAQRIEAVGQLAGGIAHDFNNLLTAIGGFGELARETGADEDFDQLRVAVQRGASLARQLLTFSRRQVVQQEPVELTALVASIVPMLARLVGERVQLDVRVGATPLTVLADRTQLEQVLMNLVVNARDAMPDGGTVSVIVEPRLVEERSVVRGSLSPGAYALLRVSDTGTGMTADVQSRIFEPYFTTKTGVERGSGLGLSVTYGIVKQSGGHIRVESEPGHGATFEVYLPHLEEARATVEPEEEPAPPKGDEAILLVEDDPEIRTMVARILGGEGYRVVQAANADEALDHAARHDVDLLLTDLVLPGAGGDALARTLLAEQPAVRVLFMSGYSETRLRDADPALRRSFLAKPFTARQLAIAVRRALDEPRLAA